MQRILSHMRKAIEKYNMIQEGDKIAVCLSGGKDSITLLYALKALQRFYPKHFDLIAISINPGFEHFDVELLQNLAYEYVNHGKNWKDLTEFEKQEWINRLFAIEYDINNRVDGLISQTKKEILKKQVDAIFSEENASNLENTYQVKEEEVSNNGPKLVLDLSQRKNIKIKK